MRTARNPRILACVAALVGAGCTSRGALPYSAPIGDAGPADAAGWDPRVEGSGEVDERGGAISVRADGAYVYLSIPPGALPRRTLVRMWVTPSSSGGTLVELSPIATQLAASAELRVTCADGCAAWRLEGDAAEPLDTRPLPGAVVVRLAALRGRYHFGPSAPLPR